MYQSQTGAPYTPESRSPPKTYVQKHPFAVNAFLSLCGGVSSRRGNMRKGRMDRPKEWALKLIRDIYDERYRVLQQVTLTHLTFCSDQNSPTGSQ